MKNSRSVYIWVILIIFILGIISSFWSFLSELINIKVLLTPSVLSNPTVNIIRLVLYLVTLCLSIIYIYKLYNFKKDIIKWTHIAFGYFVFDSFLNVIFAPNLLFAILAFTLCVVVSIITVVIWVTFVKHLKKQNIVNTNIPIKESIPVEVVENNIFIETKIKKSELLKSWIKKNKILLIILSVILFATIIIPVIMNLWVLNESKIKCGEGGYLNGDLNKGYNCSYQIVKPEYTNISQCTNSVQFCESKGKISKEGSCLSGEIDLTNKIKYDKDKGYYIEQGPIMCGYCCSLDNIETQVQPQIETQVQDQPQTQVQEQPQGFKYDPNGPYPSLLVDVNNMINARGEVVDKWANGTFKRMDTNKTFAYREKYDFNRGDMNDYNGSAVNDCIKLNCKFIYFNSGGMAIFNDIDDPAIGVIDKVTFISGGEEQSSSYIPSKLNDEVRYSITFTQGGKSGQVTTSTENICMGFKGGGFSCRAPFYSKGDKVIFVHNPSYGANYENRALSINDTFKAELISYQYSMSPDTGEVFPVVQR